MELSEIADKIELNQNKKKSLEKLKYELSLRPELCEYLNTALTAQSKLNILHEELYGIINLKEGDNTNSLRSLELVNNLIPEARRKLREAKKLLSSYISECAILFDKDLLNIRELNYTLNDNGNIDIIQTIDENLTRVDEQIAEYTSQKPKWYQFIKSLKFSKAQQKATTVVTTKYSTVNENNFKNDLICDACIPNVVPNIDDYIEAQNQDKYELEK